MGKQSTKDIHQKVENREKQEGGGIGAPFSEVAGELAHSEVGTMFFCGRHGFCMTVL